MISRLLGWLGKVRQQVAEQRALVAQAVVSTSARVGAAARAGATEGNLAALGPYGPSQRRTATDAAAQNLIARPASRRLRDGL